eukprot:TRINITY_DN48677_c0_g1_i1.p1 TRINITY_DN48677_c0_g1~~TRINITY_DN48677_c0_g1_i1.p1  ORF type:complete len:209 (+),score=15.25 TRINITY_DN48677_c0_g1_i1:166-792(+)
MMILPNGSRQTGSRSRERAAACEQGQEEESLDSQVDSGSTEVPHLRLPASPSVFSAEGAAWPGARATSQPSSSSSGYGRSQPSSSSSGYVADHVGNAASDLSRDADTHPRCDSCPDGRLCDACLEGLRNQAMHQSMHMQGICEPCAYAARKEDGCRKGLLCPYCHFCDNFAYQTWKRRTRRSRKRAEKQRQEDMARVAAAEADDEAPC